MKLFNTHVALLSNLVNNKVSKLFLPILLTINRLYKKSYIFTSLITALTAIVYADIQPGLLEGLWCAEKNTVKTLGAYNATPNPTNTESECIELKIVSADEDGGVGKYIVSKTKAKGQEYARKTHPLETYDANSQTFNSTSPGLFAFYVAADGSLVISDRSLSRQKLSIHGTLDHKKRLKYISTSPAADHMVDYASVSFVSMTRKGTLTEKFDERWDTLKEKLTKILELQR